MNFINCDVFMYLKIVFMPPPFSLGDIISLVRPSGMPRLSRYVQNIVSGRLFLSYNGPGPHWLLEHGQANKALMTLFRCTVKPVLSGHSKIDKTNVLKPCGTLMQVKSIAECSKGAFCNTLTCIKQLSISKTYF